MKKVTIFASGSGTNTQTIIEHFKRDDKSKVFFVLTNKKDAYVIERAKKMNVPVLYFSRSQFYDSAYISDILKMNGVDLIVLAGFLWLIPQHLIERFPRQIINIHPALLPNYGGKGMYGSAVHEAVFRNKDKVSGITIHYVNEEYDKGDIIFQKSCDITDCHSPEEIAEKVHALEYEYYPQVIEKLLKQDK